MADTSSATLGKNIDKFLEEFKDDMTPEQKNKVKAANEEIKKISTPLDVESIRDGLKLVSHPEGGYFSEIARSERSTVIFYLLGAHDTSAWHRIKNIEEEWRLFSGHSTKLPWIDNDGKYQEKSLNFNKSELFEKGGENGEPGVWFGAYVDSDMQSDEYYSLVICICRPPFEFQNWELISKDEVEKILGANPENALQVTILAPK